MHKETFEINVFGKGDYVRTPRGVGIVVDVDICATYFDTPIKIMVRHKFGDGDNPDNKSQIMDNSTPILITKEEYDNEVEY